MSAQQDPNFRDYSVNVPVRIYHGVLYGLVAILTGTMTIRFVRRQILRAGSLHQVIQNKFLAAIILSATALTISTMFELIWVICMLLRAPMGANAIIHSINTSLFNLASVGHATALYLRTDQSIVPQSVSKVVHASLYVYGFLAAVNGVLPCVLFFAKAPAGAFQINSFIGIFYGLLLVCVDVTYTYYFVRHVRETRRILGSSHVSITDIVAREGIKITATSITLLIVTGLAVASTSTANQWIIFTAFGVFRLVASGIFFLWMRLKNILDNTVETPAKSLNFNTTNLEDVAAGDSATRLTAVNSIQDHVNAEDMTKSMRSEAQ